MPVKSVAFCSLASIAALFATPASAEESGPLKLSGSVRLRYEAIEGQPRVGFGDEDDLVNLRTTLLAEYDAKPLKFVLEIYDSRVWGEDARTPVTNGEVNALEPVQAYVAADLGSALGAGTKTALTAGRMLLNLSSRRLVAADEYRNTTNSYTGVRADFSSAAGTRGTFIYTLPQLRLPDDLESLRDAELKLDRESFDLVLWGGYLSNPVTKKLAGSMPTIAELGFFHLGERDSPGRPTRDRSLNTVSLRAYRDAAVSRPDFDVEAMYQWGNINASLAPASARLSVSATFLHAEAGYSFPGKWKPRVALEFDRASGDGTGRRFGRFDTLFGMRRAEIAPAGLYNAVARANLSSPGVRVEVAPGKRFDAFATYKALWLANRYDGFSTTGVRDPAGRSGSFAGHQIDTRLRYWAIPEKLRFELNAVLLFKGRFLEQAPNAPRNGDTRYASVNMTTSF